MMTELTPLEVGAKMNAAQAQRDADHEYSQARQYSMKLTGQLMNIQARIKGGDATEKTALRLVKALDSIQSLNAKWGF